MTDHFDEFYIIRADLASNPGTAAEAGQSGFLAPDGTVGSLLRAARYPTLEQAEAALPGHASGAHRYSIQRCSREHATPSADHDALHRLIEQVMEIPPPYRRSAYNWLRGKNVEAILRRQGDEVFERHRKALAEHDIDITQPSTVVLMRPRRKRTPINIGDQDGNAPRQFIAAPSQRPSAAPITGEDPPGSDDD